MNCLKTLHLIIALILFTNINAQYYNGRVRIDSADRSYVFQITDNSTKPLKKVFYFWFKSGRVHKTQGSYYGKLLHGSYKVIDPDRRLLEEGQFGKGIKIGTWRTWYESGHLKTLMKPRLVSPGFTYVEYDTKGNVIKSGYVHNDLFTGKGWEWVADSAYMVRYKNGERITNIPGK